MKQMLSVLLAAVLLCSCAAAPPEETQPATTEITVSTTIETQAPDPMDVLLERMTVEELVGQLFLARYPGEAGAAESVKTNHIGSFLLFAKDFENNTPTGICMELERLQSLSSLPLIFAVDEEGGSVTRVSCHSQYRSSRFPSPRTLYDKGGLDLLLDTETEKCNLLLSLGIHLNLAPVCDIATDSNAFMYSRSLRRPPAETGQIICEMVQLSQRLGIGAVLKHFPGYGNNTDTHTGIAVDTRSLQQLEQNDLIPFSKGIGAGCGGILISHTVVNCLDSTLPASLSPAVISYLRQTMGFQGVILTDDLAMDAIADRYGAEEAAVMAVQAGNDLLCSSDYVIQFNAVLEAVRSGRIPVDRIKASVRRVLLWKSSLGLAIV